MSLSSLSTPHFQGKSQQIPDVKRCGMAFHGNVPYIITSRGYDILQRFAYPQHVLENLKPELHILDIGTGDGSFVTDLQNKGFKHAQGIDIGDALPPDKPYLQQIGIEDFHCPNNSLDRVFSSYSIFCYPESSQFQKAVLEKLALALKPGGQIHLAGLQSSADLSKIVSQVPPLRVSPGANDDYMEITKISTQSPQKENKPLNRFA